MDVSGKGGVQRVPCLSQETHPAFMAGSTRIPPSTALNEADCIVEDKDACEREERALIEEALRLLPPYDEFSKTAGSPLGSTHSNQRRLANTSLTSYPVANDDTSHALAADEEALLLQELVNITAGNAPFISSATQRERVAEGVEERNDEAKRLSGTREASTQVTAATVTPLVCATSSSCTVSSAHPLGRPEECSISFPDKSSVPAPTRSKVKAEKEEEMILETLFDVVNGQQSSISGDLVSGRMPVADTEDAKPAVNISGFRNEETDEVEMVLQRANQIATSTVLCETQRDDLVLHVHEHMTLRQRLADLRQTVGSPTCVVLAESIDSGVTAPVHSGNASSVEHTRLQSISCAMGTTLGVIVLFDRCWAVLGICGGGQTGTERARGAVVSLSLCIASASRDGEDEADDRSTAAAGHASGTFVLWSLRTLSPLRIVSDESCVPLLRVAHLHRRPTRTLALDSSGAVTLYQFWKMLTKYTVRVISIVPSSPTVRISDIDTLPCPSAFYLTHLSVVKERLLLRRGVGKDGDGGVSWLCAPPPLSPAAASEAGLSPTRWTTVPGKHFVAAVRSDAVLVYLVEDGYQCSVSCLALHSRQTLATRGSELVRFVVSETETTNPKLLLCVSWNMEVELLLMDLRVAEPHVHKSSAVADPMMVGLVRLAMIRVPAPVLQMVPLAGCSVLLCDENQDAQLMDASVAVIVERHHFNSFEYIGLTNRLGGLNYNGSATSNRSTALLMGKGRAYSIGLRSWKERLSALMARQKVADALDLAKGFAEEVALSTVGLSSDAAQRRCELHQFIERILVAYVKSRLSSFPIDQVTEKSGVEHSKELIGSSNPSRETQSLFDFLKHIVVYCSAVDGLNLLYGPLIYTLQQRGLLLHLLCVLEHCMRYGIVTYMPEPLVAQFIHLYLDGARLGAVERSLGLQQKSAISGDEARGNDPHQNQDNGLARSESGRERAEISLMHLETGLPSLLRLAEEHGLVRLTVSILSLRQQRYVDALAYAMDEEQKADNSTRSAYGNEPEMCAPPVGKCSSPFSSAGSASVAIDLVECALKGGHLLPEADIPSSEQRLVKKALLEYLLQATSKPARHDNRNPIRGEDYHLLRFVRRQPEHAIRLLLFALSDEGPFSPWGGADGLCRTQYVSSIYFILTGGSRNRPGDVAEGDWLSLGPREQGPLDIFRVEDELLARLPSLKVLRATELAQRPYPPYITIHTLLAGAAIFTDLFLSTDPEEVLGVSSSRPPVRLDVWIDLVIQDLLFTFQHAETAEERRQLQEHLLRVLAPDVVPRRVVAAYQSDFERLHMTRCLAAVLCEKQRYAEAIACYSDPKQNCVDAQLRYDVFSMIRSEMQRLQNRKAQAMNALQPELGARQRSESSILDDARVRAGAAGSSEVLSLSGEPATSVTPSDFGDHVGRHPSKESSQTMIGGTDKNTTSIDTAIKGLQRAVMHAVEVLARIDTTALVQFMFDYLPSNHGEVMRLLRGSSVAFLDYLHELMTQENQTVTNDICLQNTYIGLLCTYAPERVYPYIRQKGNRVTYDAQLALRVVRKHRIADATVYLLEEMMMMEEAMEVMLDAVRERLGAFREEVLACLGADAKTVTETSSYQQGIRPELAYTTTVVGESGKAANTHACEEGGIPGKNSSPPVFDVAALGSATELWRFVEIGKELCNKYEGGFVDGGSLTACANVRTPAAAKHSAPVRSAQCADQWFRLLDVFMVPRRLLYELMTQDDMLAGVPTDGGVARSCPPVHRTVTNNELELATRLAMSSQNGADAATQARTCRPNEQPPRLPNLTEGFSSEPRHCAHVLVEAYTQYASSILKPMMCHVGISAVMAKLLHDHRNAAFRSLKPIMMDMVASLNFDLKASQLCKRMMDSDTMLRGREHHRNRSIGVAPQSDCCAVCRSYLRQLTPSLHVGGGDSGAATVGTPSAVLIYACGHAFHTICAMQAMGSQKGCWVCKQERFLSGQPVRGTRDGGVGVFAKGAFIISGSAGISVEHRDRPEPPVTAPVRSVETTLDVGRMQRRVHQTKARIDHAGDVYAVLKSFIVWPASASHSQLSDTGTLTTGKSESWSAPRDAKVSKGRGGLPMGATTVQENLLDVDGLTDTEILELFGEP